MKNINLLFYDEQSLPQFLGQTSSKRLNFACSNYAKFEMLNGIKFN